MSIYPGPVSAMKVGFFFGFALAFASRLEGSPPDDLLPGPGGSAPACIPLWGKVMSTFVSSFTFYLATKHTPNLYYYT